jgi:peptidoglycan/LPS O-acetylase OafA/YrhL
MTPISRPYIERLDIVRGLAIFLVFIFHAQIDLYPDYVTPQYVDNFIQIKSLKEGILQFNPAAFGWVGVTLFFIISGFLIHLGYLGNRNKFTVITFYSKRFWRIYPVYFLVLLFFCFARNQGEYYLYSKQGFFDLFTHVFLIHNFWESTIFSINGAFWSLAVEFQLYLLYPILVYASTKKGLKPSLFVLFVLAIATRLILAAEIIEHHIIFPIDMLINAWFTWCLGAYLAEKYVSGKKVIPSKSNLLLVFLFALFILSKVIPLTGYFTNFFGVFAWFVFMERLLHSKRKFTAFYFKIAVYIGLCSYSLYLIHQPILNDLLNYYNINNQPILKILPVFAIIFFISYSLYLFVELNSVKIGNKIRSRIKLKAMRKMNIDDVMKDEEKIKDGKILPGVK